MKVVVSLGLLVCLAACSASPAPSEAPPGAVPAAESGSGASGDEPLVTCRLTVAEAQVETLELRSDDGGCKLLLPLAVSPGSLPIRVAASADEAVAAFEVRQGSQTFYGSEGELKVDQSDGQLLRGSVAARDANPPGLARLQATFEIRRSGQ